MKNPLLSIIVPVYNVEKYLRTSLDSIFVQDTDDCEILLINDGSRMVRCLCFVNMKRNIGMFV